MSKAKTSMRVCVYVRGPYAVQSDERYMVVTIKHSGSLVTLSGEGFAAKNSVNNEYTAGVCEVCTTHTRPRHSLIACTLSPPAHHLLRRVCSDMCVHKVLAHEAIASRTCVSCVRRWCGVATRAL